MSGNSFQSKFQLRFPLILAPMAGGPTTPELVAAVCNAGGLGSIAAPYLKPADIEKVTAQVRELTKNPFVINLFAPAADPQISDDQIALAQQVTKKFRDELHLPPAKINPPYSEDFEAQFQTVLKLKPAAVSFTLGNFSEKHISELQQTGIYVMGTATTVDEALHPQKSGVDAIVLQGTEAGGHRGIIDSQKPEPGIGVFDLIKECSQKINIPLIAAGGLMTGADIAKAISYGASAGQLGTAFLLCDEAGTSAPYRERLRSAKPGETELTRAFSGRLARGLKNYFMAEMKPHTQAILPFPAQNVFTRDLRKASAEQGRSDYISLWAGSEVHRIREMSATKLTTILEQEFKAATSNN